MNPALLPSILVGAAVIAVLLAALAVLGARCRPPAEPAELDDVDEANRYSAGWIAQSRSRSGRP